MLKSNSMSQIFNVYCDESCHLEHDHKSAMVLGAVWCPKDISHDIFKDIRDIKTRHGLKSNFEIKWTKVSPSKLDFYLSLIDYFFSNDNLHFRCLVVPDKSIIDHNKVEGQTHDSWYYKMYFLLLQAIINPQYKYRVFIDIKDTNGGEKKEKLHEVLNNSNCDFDSKIVEKIQIVKSDEIELVQIADLLIGVMSYLSRGIDTSTAKNALVQRVREKSGYKLVESTLVREDKFNIFVWRSRLTQ